MPRRSPPTWGLLMIMTCLAVTHLPAHGAEPDVEHARQAETADVPAIDEILERYIKALGGRDAIGRLETRIGKGFMITDLPSRTPPVYEVDTLELYIKAPDSYLLISHTAQGGTISEGWNGSLGWKQDSEGLRGFDSTERSWLALLLNPQGPLHMKEYFPDLSVRGQQVRQGRHLIVLDTGHGSWLYFDSQSGLLMSWGYGELYNYREVDGVKAPHRVVYSRKGGSTIFMVEDLRHNDPLDESLFARPNPYAAPPE